MNRKVLGVIAGLLLTTSLVACSSGTTDTQNQTDPNASPATENTTSGTATEKEDTTKKDSAATEKEDTTKKEGAATEKEDTTKKDSAATEKEDTTKKDSAATEKENTSKTEGEKTKP
ncbi:MAG: hypothetical protein Fur006_40760 [Coleofasciculaceae cyanobacterium]